MSNYDYTETHTAVGLAVKFNGPGMSEYITIHPHSTHEANSILSMLKLAYEAGRSDKAEEVRRVLGIHDTPWGVKIERK